MIMDYYNLKSNQIPNNICRYTLLVTQSIKIQKQKSCLRFLLKKKKKKMKNIIQKYLRTWPNHQARKFNLITLSSS